MAYRTGDDRDTQGAGRHLVSDRDTEAAHWFARMRTPGAEAGRAEFDAWHADPENAAAYADAKEDWLITGGVAEENLTAHRQEIGSASGRESVCPYVEISVAAVTLKKKKKRCILQYQYKP